MQQEFTVSETSVKSNSPLKNKNFIISSDKNNIPKNAGIEKIPNSKGILSLASAFCFLSLALKVLVIMPY